MSKINFCYTAALSNSILKRRYRVFTMNYYSIECYSCYPFEIIAIFWREKSQNLLDLEPSFWEQRSKYPYFGNLPTTNSNRNRYLHSKLTHFWSNLSLIMYITSKKILSNINSSMDTSLQNYFSVNQPKMPPKGRKTYICKVRRICRNLLCGLTENFLA